MYYLGKIIGAFFNQLFRWLFWNKKGQKVLFTILIFLIAVCFIKLGEVSAVEDTRDINFEVYDYYDNLTNDFILRFDMSNNNNNRYAQEIISNLQNGYTFYLCYNASNGSSYNGGYPANKAYINVIMASGDTLTNGSTASNYDYMGVPTFTQRSSTGAHVLYRFNRLGGIEKYTYDTDARTVYFPYQLYNLRSDTFATYLTSLLNNDTEQIKALLEDIKTEQQKTNEALTNTTPSSETDSFVNVDSSAIDNVDTSNIDNVFSSLVTDWGNKFQYYDFSQDMYQYVINIKGTNIVIRSDLIYNMIKDTWFYPLLQLLWYYIFGHYAFVWLSNLIHRIKDGSILDGLNPHDVLTSEIL